MIPNVVTLADAKLYLRVEHDHHDTVIDQLIGAATEEALCLADALDRATLTPDNVPPTVRVAILLQVARLYDEGGDCKVPAGTITMASRHRSWGV